MVLSVKRHFADAHIFRAANNALHFAFFKSSRIACACSRRGFPSPPEKSERPVFSRQFPLFPKIPVLFPCQSRTGTRISQGENPHGWAYSPPSCPTPRSPFPPRLPRLLSRQISKNRHSWSQAVLRSAGPMNGKPQRCERIGTAGINGRRATCAAAAGALPGSRDGSSSIGMQCNEQPVGRLQLGQRGEHRYHGRPPSPHRFCHAEPGIRAPPDIPSTR